MGWSHWSGDAGDERKQLIIFHRQATPAIARQRQPSPGNARLRQHSPAIASDRQSNFGIFQNYAGDGAARA